MNYGEANEMAAKFKSMAAFSKVVIGHHGFVERVFGGDNSAVDNDGKWRVELWFLNPKTGTTTLEVVQSYTTDAKMIVLIAKKAQGKATKADAKAMASIAADNDRLRVDG